ncbi:MAG: hypothetical protein WBI14_00940 [Anaerolineaceae bacterium]
MAESKPDKTRNQRQARRREREKQWLTEHGWTSWEALHTALVKGNVTLNKLTYDQPKIGFKTND